MRTWNHFSDHDGRFCHTHLATFVEGSFQIPWATNHVETLAVMGAGCRRAVAESDYHLAGLARSQHGGRWRWPCKLIRLLRDGDRSTTPNKPLDLLFKPWRSPISKHVVPTPTLQPQPTSPSRKCCWLCHV